MTHWTHTLFLDEKFDRETLDARLTWLNAPSVWRVDRGRSRLLIEPDSQTDFWQRTHYGFRADSGHFLYCAAPHHAIVTAKFHSYPAQQYDQAGLMVRYSEDCWLKTSVESEQDGPSHLGAVVTNQGYSDWSLQDFPYPGELSYCLRVRMEGADLLVEHAPDESGPWKLLRVAHLFPESGSPAVCGVYACSPKGSGYRVEVEFLRILAEKL